MRYRRFEDLPVWKASVELADRVYRLIEGGRFAGVPALRDQMERAALSVSNNIAEGFDRGTHAELITFLYIANGSAGEVRSMTYVMERRVGFAGAIDEVRAIRSLSESVGRQLGSWLESLKNSDEKGPRHRNDETRRRAEQAQRGDAFLKQMQQLIEDARRSPAACPESPPKPTSPSD